MKAFRQVTFHHEQRLVWSYTAALILIGFFIMLRPLFAQEEDPIPEVKVDVKKEYDEQGNLLRLDSVRTWYWSGKHFSQSEFDSVWREMGEHFEYVFPRNFDPFGYDGHSQGNPLHHYWFWNGEDSSAYSCFDRFFDEDFSKSLKEMEQRIEQYQKEHQQLIDKYFREKFQDEDIDPDAEPNKYIPVPEKIDPSKTGRI